MYLATAAISLAAARPADSDVAGGLGLGLFISKALLERTGAELRIANRLSPHHGAVAAVSRARRQFATEPRAGDTAVDAAKVKELGLDGK